MTADHVKTVKQTNSSFQSGAPIVTILTPALNCVASIGAALDSVAAQTDCPSIEHIVLDGGSLDGTLEVLSGYSQVTVISERDANLYDALNKGLRIAGGEVIGLLNADDTYSPHAVARALETLQRYPQAAMACGGADVVDHKGRLVVRHDGAVNRSLAVEDVVFGVPIINARFFRRSLFSRLGGFDVRYGVAADREFLLRAALAGEIAASVEGIAYVYCCHGGSLTIGGSGALRRIAADHMALAEDWLRRKPPVPPVVKQALAKLHAQGALMGLLAAARCGDWGAAIGSVRRGMGLRQDWPLAAAGISMSWLARRLSRSLRHRKVTESKR